MNDLEWTELRALWHRKEEALSPDFRAYARRQSRELWIGILLFVPLTGIGIAFATWLFCQPAVVLRATACAMWAVLVSVSSRFVASHRALWPRPMETPGETLARLERALRRDRTESRLGAALTLAVTLLGVTVIMFERGGLRPLWASSPSVFGILLAAVGFALIGPRWASAKADRDQRLLDGWKA